MIGDRTRTAIVWIITSLWVLNFILAWRVDDYKGSESVNAIFMAVITATFVSGARRREEVEREVEDDKKKPKRTKRSR